MRLPFYSAKQKVDMESLEHSLIMLIVLIIIINQMLHFENFS